MTDDSINDLFGKVDNLLVEGDLEKASAIISVLFDRIKSTTINSFYVKAGEFLTKGKFLKEFIEVYQATAIPPDVKVTKDYANAVYTLYKKQGASPAMEEAIKVCYDLLLKHEMPKYFIKLYKLTEIEPPNDIIYQALMLTRSQKAIEMKREICEMFGIVD
jgi:hypothetical protein